MTGLTPNQGRAQAAGFPTTAAWIVSLATRARTAEQDLADAHTEIARLNTLIDAARHQLTKETK